MSKELYINGYLIELSDKTNIGVTYQANTLSDISTRQGFYSNEFFAPKSQSNQIALGFASNINSTTNVPYKLNDVKYIENGIEIVVGGFAIVNSFTTGYSIAVYSGNCDFFDLIADKMLTDLDLTDLNHNFTAANVTASYTNTGGYIYPNVETRKPTSALSPHNAGRIPFMFIHTLMERIAAAVGYTLGGDLLEDNYYINEILSTDFKRDQAWQDSVNSKTILLADNNITDIISGGAIVVYNIGFPASGYIVGGLYTVPEDMSASFSATIPMKFGLTGSGSSFGQTASMEIVNVTTATILDADAINVSTDIGTDPERFYTFSVNTGTQTLSPGDQIQIRFSYTYTAIGIYKFSFLTGATYGASVRNGFIPYLGGSINMASIQPTMKQTDFVKGILNMNCAIPQPNLATRVLYLNKLDNIEAKKAIAKDWSDKFDKKQPLTITFRDTNFAKKNTFVYSNDDDIKAAIQEWNFYETDGFITSPDETLDAQKNLITLPFSGTKENIIPYKNDDYSMDAFTPRVLLLLRFYRNLAGVVTYLPPNDNAFFSYTTQYESLSFNKAFGVHDCLLDNYQVITNILNRYKKIGGSCDINALDISELDFSIPIYLDFIHQSGATVNGFFYLNKVGPYKESKILSQVELIEL